MYFVDRKKIEHTLGFFERQLALFHSQTGWKSEIEGLALERIGHLLIECILDTGNDMIDGFIMRDPGSYDDIMDILVDEKVVTEEEGAQLKQLIAYRKTLVQQYQLADSAELYKLITAHLAVLQAFPKRIRIYLETELGPVSAFK
ncbi:DUF86 domain-containing protein [Bacillus mojavensis]|uniref:DUF86 domain-containing protein n=1 Tax=Bacillus mojavensis TaxID=72360 RepID=UPI002DB575CD|nr:DUF86 domain-containing protein [Bacillus mojavensis]MEC1614379.1 DUF86 domain-containing protein [Bacillus mojavensis]MEC1634622.1 DUF86 domain-containing protein [Bacillus mojavensis]MEC1683571.1 DUF86 domain-containing protein [Bacillus mojavensis]MEC1691533.1 DUF86 domain-containing protein [Bacillus mojavensis]MEC1709977.1 DUF86 domain-containing protein [Bacillus mojavensis]